MVVNDAKVYPETIHLLAKDHTPDVEMTSFVPFQTTYYIPQRDGG